MRSILNTDLQPTKDTAQSGIERLSGSTASARSIEDLSKSIFRHFHDSFSPTCPRTAQELAGRQHSPNTCSHAHCCRWIEQCTDLRSHQSSWFSAVRPQVGCRDVDDRSERVRF